MEGIVEENTIVRSRTAHEFRMPQFVDVPGVAREMRLPPATLFHAVGVISSDEAISDQQTAISLWAFKITDFRFQKRKAISSQPMGIQDFRFQKMLAVMRLSLNSYVRDSRQ